MSEKYSSHKDWTFGMECELPYKVRFALNRLPDSMTFLEVTHGGDTVIRLFSDMGRETRTIEIVTEPLKIGQEKGGIRISESWHFWRIFWNGIPASWEQYRGWSLMQ